MKTKNLFLIALTTVLVNFTLNVKANTAVDTNKCENGKVYTNYYFLLEADGVGNGTTDVGGHAATGEDYNTIGYFKNVVGDTSLKSVVDTYGFASDEFAAVAQRSRGTVPISSSNPTQALSINGVGLRTFYSILTSTATNDGNDSYLIEHNWKKLNGQVVKDSTNYTITFSSSDIANMVNATVLLNQYEIGNGDISPYDDYPTALQILRKYSQGTTPNISNITPIDLPYSDNQTRASYLQPALYYIQYCKTKTSSDTPTDENKFVVKYDANGGKNAPATSSETNVGTCVNISSDKPTRSGYSFLGWSRDKDATAADSNYDAGKCYKGADGNITLYAIWKSSSVVNPGTGIASHILSYMAIIALGVGGLIIASKKGLFRQL